jgi:hypothetical protein
VNGGVALAAWRERITLQRQMSQHSAGAFTRKFAQWILNGAGSRRRNKSAERTASNQALTNDV